MKSKNSNSINSHSEEITKNLINSTFNNQDENFYNNENFEYEQNSHRRSKSQHFDNELTKEFFSDNEYNSYPYEKKRQAKESFQKYKNNFFDDYEDDYDDEEYSMRGFKITISLLVSALTIATIFLTINTISLKSNLKSLNENYQSLTNAETESERKLFEDEVKSQLAKLTETVESLTSSQNINNNNNSTQNNQSSNTNSQQNNVITNTNSSQNTQTQQNTSQNNSNLNNSREYIVVKGDSIWAISQKIYGSGAHYQKILSANGLTEDSQLKEGQKLIIPEI